MLNSISRSFVFLFVALALVTAGYNRATSPDQVTAGMTKTQVKTIMGPPTTMASKDMVIFKRATYRYEEGAKFAMFTFKNDELDSKDGNLATQL